MLQRYAAGQPGTAALSAAEVLQLMQAFTAGKTAVLEDDCVTLLRWAVAQRVGNAVLDLVLEGTLTPVVEGAEVTLELRQPQGEAA